MRQDYKGFTVPEKIWRSENLDMNAKFVACCLIDYATKNSLAKGRDESTLIYMSTSTYKDILSKHRFEHEKFIFGAAKLMFERFATNLNFDENHNFSIKIYF